VIRRIVSLAVAAALFAALPAAAKVRVAASTTDLASIAANVGGDDIEVFSIARPTADPHRGHLSELDQLRLAASACAAFDAGVRPSAAAMKAPVRDS